MSFTQKIFFSFAILILAGFSGNIFLLFKVSQMQTITKNQDVLYQLQTRLQEIENSFSRQTMARLSFHHGKVESFYQEFLKENQNFIRAVENFRQYPGQTQEEVKKTLNRIIETHDRYLLTFREDISAGPQQLKRNQNQEEAQEVKLNLIFAELYQVLSQAQAQQGMALDSIFSQLDRILLGLVLGMVILAFILAYIIIKGIILPVRKLLIATRFIGRGNFNYSVESAHIDPEIGELIDAFQDMSRELNKYRENLIENERLNTVGDMTSSMSHEINNPLMVITGNVEMLKIQFKGQPVAQKQLDTILENINRITEIIRKLGEIKKIILESYSPDGKNRLIKLDGNPGK
jgi:nitrogen fixation/metabolism regulation signal transduction histidine kinase